MNHRYPQAQAGLSADTDIGVVLENTADPIVYLDNNWRYEYVNHAAEMLLRRKRDSLLGRSHWEEYPHLIGTPAEQYLRMALEQQRTVTFEQSIPGLYAWHSVTAIPSGGRLILFIRDVSERVRALRDDAVRAGLRSILEHVPVAITVTRGGEHRIEFQNAGSRALLGGRNVEGSTVRNAVPEALEHDIIAILDQVFGSGQAYAGKEIPLIYQRDGGGSAREAYFDLSYQPIFDVDGRVSGILHLAVDVTDRRTEKELLARFAAERDATLRQLADGVILTDASGRITFVNKRAAELHGVSVLDIGVEAYASAYQLLTPQGTPYPPTELPLARAVLHDEFVANAHWCIRRPDGSEIAVEGSAQPVFDEQMRKIACVLVMRPLD